MPHLSQIDGYPTELVNLTNNNFPSESLYIKHWRLLMTIYRWCALKQTMCSFHITIVKLIKNFMQKGKLKVVKSLNPAFLPKFKACEYNGVQCWMKVNCIEI